MKKIILLSCLLILLPLSVFASTINVPTIDHPTIQAGINASVDGDVVLLADGTYTGVGNYNIDFNGKSITVKSVGGADVCIVDCEENGRGFLAYSGETVTLEGLTVENGDAGGNDGGGVYLNSSDAVIIDCIFNGNSADSGGAVFSSGFSFSFTNCTFTSNSASSGGAVYSGLYSSSSFTNCTFTSNNADSYGGAVHTFQYSSSSFTNCTFTSNNGAYQGGAVYSQYNSSSSFTNCTFTSNNASYQGGAVYSSSFSGVSYSSFTNCTFTLNEATTQGGAIWCDISLAPEDPITLKNCILWGNTAPEGAEIYEAEKPLIITYSDIQDGHTGTGNIDSDPLFVDAANDDLHLQLSSFCIDTGTADGAPSDDLDDNFRPTGSGYDMGAYEYQGPIVIDSFTVSPTSGKPSLTVDFTCVAHDDANTITAYQWNFGDGNTDTTLTGTTQRTYIIPGTFTATCTVVNDNSDQTTASTTIEVTNDIPIVDAGSDQIIPGSTVDLDGSASNDPDGSIVSWSWTLEYIGNSTNDKTATGEMPTVTNLIKGNYIVTLTVTDNYGSTGTDEMHLCVAGSSAIYTQAELDQAKQDSYGSGHAAGVTEGSAAGYTEGHTAGVTEGHAAGYTEGHTAGTAEGYTEGHAAGVTEGHAAGYTEGHTAGTAEGYTEGHTAGVTEGHAAGYTEGHTAGVAEGYTAGYSEGHVTGVAAGYAEGRTAGITEGYSSGYSEGHTVGVAEGSAAGYEEGHVAGVAEGYATGYVEGYTAGQDDCEECPIYEDAEGNKFLGGPLTIEDNGLLTIQ